MKVKTTTVRKKDEDDANLFVKAPADVDDEGFLGSDGESPDDDDERAHNNFISDINKITKKRKMGAAPRSVRFSAKEGGTAVDTQDILKRIGVPVLERATLKMGTLRAPLEKVVVRRTKRAVGYDKVSCETEKWGSLVYRRRVEGQLTFPLQQADIRINTAMKTEEVKMSTPLEREVYSLLQGSKLIEDKKETNEETARRRAMSLDELKERNRLAWRQKEERRRIQRKASRQNKNKSRTYHRLLRRDKLKQQKSEFAELEKTDPEAALEKLEELEKIRAEERMTLRHRKSKWAHLQGLRAPRDEKAMAAVKENQVLHQELVAKRKLEEESSDEDEDKIEKKLDALRKEKQQAIESGLFDPSNPWMANLFQQVPEKVQLTPEGAIDNSFVNFKKFWDEVNKRKLIEKKALEAIAKSEDEEEEEEEEEGDSDDEEKNDGDSVSMEAEESLEIVRTVDNAKKKDAEKGKVDPLHSDGKVTKKKVKKVKKADDKIKSGKKVKTTDDKINSEKKVKKADASVKKEKGNKVENQLSNKKGLVKKKITKKVKKVKEQAEKGEESEESPLKEVGNTVEKQRSINSLKEKKMKKIVTKKTQEKIKDKVEPAEKNQGKIETKGKKKMTKKVGKVTMTTDKKQKRVKKKKIEKSKPKEEGSADEVDLDEHLMSIDNMFNQAELALQKKLKKKLSKLGMDSDKEWTKVKPKKKRKKVEGKGILPKIEEFDFTAKKDQDNIDEGLERAKTFADMDALRDKSESEDHLQKAAKTFQMGESDKKANSEAKKKAPPKIAQIDPSKFLQVDAKLLQASMPDTITRGSEGLDDEEEDDAEDVIRQAFAEDYLVDEFKSQKDAAIENDKPKPLSLALPGWGDWTGPNIKMSNRKRKRFTIRAPPAPPRKDATMGNVIYDEKADVHANLRKSMVSDLPYPFSRVQDFEASVRAPIGRLFVPEKEHKKLTAPPVITKIGTIIEAMTEEELLKTKERGNSKMRNRNKKIKREKWKKNTGIVIE